MQIIINLLVGLLIMGIGSALVIKTEWFLENVGRMEFFETKLGTAGGSRLGYKLIGLFLMFIGLLWATGMIGGFIMWVFSPITKLTNPPVLQQ